MSLAAASRDLGRRCVCRYQASRKLDASNDKPVIAPGAHPTRCSFPCAPLRITNDAHASQFTDRMIIFMTLLIAGASMAFAVHQWRRGYHLIAIGFITFACLIAGVGIEAAKNNQNAATTEVLRQP